MIPPQRRRASRAVVPAALVIVAAAIVLAVSGWLRREPLRALADNACASGQMMLLNAGYLPLLGYGDGGDQILSRQETSDRTRILMIVGERCGGSEIARDKPFNIILGHVTDTRPDSAEVFYYLADLRGELLKVVRAQPESDRKMRYALAEASDKNRRADFEAEKKFWLTKYGLAK